MLKNKESFDTSPNMSISLPNHHSSPKLRVLGKLSTKGNELKAQ